MSDDNKKRSRKQKPLPFEDPEWGTDRPRIVEVRKGLPPKNKNEE